MKFSFLLAFSLVFSGCYDTVTTSYDNTDEIKKDRAIERGWIPSIIPKSAYTINEQHDLDTNVCKGTFLFKDEDKNVFKENLGNQVKGKVKTGLIEKYKITEFSIYQWENFILSVDWTKNKAEFVCKY